MANPNRTRIRIPRRDEDDDGRPLPPASPDPEPDRGRVPNGDVPGPAVVLPAGPIQTPAPWGEFAFDWEQVTQWYALARDAATAATVPWDRILATIVIESGGNPRARQENDDNGWSYGLVQVVPFGVRWEGWHSLVRDVAGLPARATARQVQDALYDPAINLRVGAAILASAYRQHGTWDRASSAFFLGNPDWRGRDTVNGNTGAAYKRSLDGLIAEIEAATRAGLPTVPPKPEPHPSPVDPIAIIVGTARYTADYGWLSDIGKPLYHYGVGHGTTRPTQHPALDIPLGCGSPLFSPAAGVVDCVGSRGQARWGQVCGAYEDVDGGGVGNVTIYLDGGVKLTLGHCRTALVKPGQRVTAGQQVATVGSYDGCHMHIETSVERNGTYWLVEPRAALAPLLAPPDPHAGLVRHPIAGATAIWLPPQIGFTRDLTPGGPNRPGKPMAANGTVFHETGNPRRGADAQMHADWQANGTPGHPDGKIGVHFYVDDHQVIQCIPVNEQGIHAGDARNRSTIGVELCVNQDRDAAKAERNAAYLHATLLRDVLGTTVAAMEPHTRTACPATINGASRWPQVQSEVARLIANGVASPGTTTSTPTYPGLTIPVAAFEALFVNPAWPADPTGPITRYMVEHEWFYPLMDVIRDGTVAYAITGGGLLRYRDGKVEKV